MTLTAVDFGWNWQDAAACKGLDVNLFFGPFEEARNVKQAREAEAALVCATCPVRAACDRFAEVRPEKYGTWGGLGEGQRRRRRNVRSGAVERDNARRRAQRQAARRVAS